MEISSGTSEEVKWKSLSHVGLCDLMDYTVHGLLQARILEWIAFPFSRGSSPPRNWTHISCIAGGFFTCWATREDQPGNSSPNMLHVINGTVIVFKTRGLQVTPQALPLHSHFLKNAASCVINNLCLPFPYFNYLLSAPGPATSQVFIFPAVLLLYSYC